MCLDYSGKSIPYPYRGRRPLNLVLGIQLRRVTGFRTFNHFKKADVHYWSDFEFANEASNALFSL